jgi:hypothetical protein
VAPVTARCEAEVDSVMDDARKINQVMVHDPSSTNYQPR